jgi:hypothetical protein
MGSIRQDAIYELAQIYGDDIPENLVAGEQIVYRSCHHMGMFREAEYGRKICDLLSAARLAPEPVAQMDPRRAVDGCYLLKLSGLKPHLDFQ